MKSNTRKRHAVLRDSLGPEDRLKFSKLIKENVFQLKEYKEAKTVLLYFSFGSEVKTVEMIKETIKKKTTLLPLVVHIKKSIIACEVKNIEKDVEAGFSKISEPKKHCKKYVTDQIDLIIVPGIAFGEKGERLGYGGGYYDRYLKDFTGNIIGICFENQLTDKIILEEHDVPMHKIITEKRIIDCQI